MAWKKTFIERLINHRYNEDGAGNIELTDDHVFDGAEDHQKWYYSYDSFNDDGLKEFDEDGKPAGSNAHRRAIDKSVTKSGGQTHAGEPVPNGVARQIEHTVRDNVDNGLFGGQAGADRHDVFHAVREKIHHVYHEGVRTGRGGGVGQATYAIGEDEVFTAIVTHILAEFGSGGAPSKPPTQELFKRMAEEIRLFDLMAKQDALKPLTKEEIDFYYDLASRGPAANDHDSW